MTVKIIGKATDEGETVLTRFIAIESKQAFQAQRRTMCKTALI